MVDLKYDLILRNALNDRSLAALVAGMTKSSLSRVPNSEKSASSAGDLDLKYLIMSGNFVDPFSALCSGQHMKLSFQLVRIKI